MRSRAPAAARIWLHSYAVSRRIGQYSELTKPGISLFVALSAATGYVVAAQANATWTVALLVIACTALMSAGAAGLNQVIEAEHDRNMRRTARRPVAAGSIDALAAKVFAWSLTGCGLLVALTLLPPLTSVFLVLSHITYVNVYTPLKSRTPLCTLVGGFPGSLPVLAGAVASGSGITLPGLLLTGLLFTWQMPHFMAIGWLSREDYARVNDSMLFLTEPTGATSAAVAVMYAAAMGGCGMLLSWAMSATAFFAVTAAICAITYTVLAAQFRRERSRIRAHNLFLSSLLILPLMLLALVMEVLRFR